MVVMELATVSAVNLTGYCGRDSAGHESRHPRQGWELTILGGGKEKVERK